MDKSSNEVWINANYYDDWETSRPLLFRDDMRDMFFKWFRIKPSDNVLDGGCGTGVLTRFIAKGLDTGRVTGFDISLNFVRYGNEKIKEEGLSDRAKIIHEDGFNLSFLDNTFDVVVNHTYLGVLSDNISGLKEMIRVCKQGGNISVSVSSRSFPKINWDGDSLFLGKSQLNELSQKYKKVHKKIFNANLLKRDTYWHVMRFPKMFAKCGLSNIMIHPYASGFSYNDNYWSDEFKKNIAMTGIERQIEILREQKNNPKYKENGFYDEDFDELIELYKQKQSCLLDSNYNDDNWSWNANMHYIVTGTKV